VATTFAQASDEIAKLLRCLTDQKPALVDISNAQAALETLPMTADEFSLAANRLRNAHRYASVSEDGASRYELQLLAASLQKLRQRYV
jgi:hypothetical protein